MPPRATKREFRRVIPNRMKELGKLASEVEGYLSKAGVDAETIYAVQLSLEELLTNLVKYAYHDSREHEIRVLLNVEARQVRLVVEDDGHPFNPAGAPVPDLNTPLRDRFVGGLGLHLVRNMASFMSYESKGGWNCLTLGFEQRIPDVTNNPA